MAPRRKLAEGLKADPAIEEEFVRTGKVKPSSPAPRPAEPAAPREVKGQEKPVGRAPLTTRIRSDFSTALKRASLERQLDGVLPNTLQAILEEALEPWLRKHGYLQ
jgi:hypothetical protein